MNLEDLLEEAKRRTKSGQKNWYEPFPSEQSKIIQDYYRSQINIPLNGDFDMMFFNSAGTLIGIGYERIVISDFGAYIEFDQNQIQHANIEKKWPGGDEKHIKYIWMETKDGERTKVYFQQRKVRYADYRPRYYYVHVSKIFNKLDEKK